MCSYTRGVLTEENIGAAHSLTKRTRCQAAHAVRKSPEMNVASVSAALVAAALLSGCASVRCEPLDVVVDAREERMRLVGDPRGVSIDERGRVRHERHDLLVPSYWIRSRDGAWYEVSETVWRAAEPGRVLSVCR